MQDVLGARSPGVGVEALEDGHDAVGGQLGVVPQRRQGVHPDWRPAVGGIEHDDVVTARLGHPVENVADEIALGIDDDQPATGPQVGQDRRQHQVRLAGAGDAEQVTVVQRVAGR